MCASDVVGAGEGFDASEGVGAGEGDGSMSALKLPVASGALISAALSDGETGVSGEAVSARPEDIVWSGVAVLACLCSP